MSQEFDFVIASGSAYIQIPTGYYARVTRSRDRRTESHQSDLDMLRACFKTVAFALLRDVAGRSHGHAIGQ